MYRFRSVYLFLTLVLILALSGCFNQDDDGTPTELPPDQNTNEDNTNDDNGYPPPDGPDEPDDPDEVSLDAFVATLQTAVSNRDYDAIQPLVASPFNAGPWQSEFSEVNAVEYLQNTALASDTTVTFDDSQPVEELVGADLSHLNGDRLLFSRGWGQDGNGEAILVITQQDGGAYRWSHLVLAPNGFQDPLVAFVEELSAAITSRDYAKMQILMADEFMVQVAGTTGFTESPAEVATYLQETVFASDTPITVSEEPDPELEGATPDPNPVKLLYSTGWGPDGDEKGVITIGQNPDDLSLEWTALHYELMGSDGGGGIVEHTVKQGEWLIQIAECYGTTVRAIRDANNIYNPHHIEPNQVLTIPNVGSVSGNLEEPCLIDYTVEAGDTLHSIATEYNVSLNRLVLANFGYAYHHYYYGYPHYSYYYYPNYPTYIYPGQKLVIPVNELNAAKR